MTTSWAWSRAWSLLIARLPWIGVQDTQRSRAFYEALGSRGVGGTREEPVFFQAAGLSQRCMTHPLQGRRFPPRPAVAFAC